MAEANNEEAHQPTARDVQNWLMSLSAGELNETLNSLGLRTAGEHFEKLTRLHKRLRGDYSEDDFQQSSAPADQIRVKREEIRRSFIHDMCWEKSATTIQDEDYEKGLPHPLSFFMKDGAITASEEIDANSRDPNTTTEQGAPPGNGAPQQDRESEGGKEEAPTEVETAVEKGLQHLMNVISTIAFKTDEKHKTLLETISKQEVAINTLQMQIARLTEKDGQRRGPMSSTRLDTAPETVTGSGTNPTPTYTPFTQGVGRGRVNFQETFTTSYPQNSSMREEIMQAGEVSSFHDQETWRGNVTGGVHQNPTEQMPSNRGGRDHEDPSRIVSRWNIKFAAAPGENVETFLRRFEESARSAKLTGNDKLASLPCVLTDIAGLWYSNHNENWRTWEDFVRAIRRWFSNVHDKQDQLRKQIERTCQHEGEPSSNYATRMEGLLREVIPRYPPVQEVDLIYTNLLPPIKRIVAKERCATIDNLVERCSRAEYTLERERAMDRSPIPPNAAAIPEAVYKGPTGKAQKPPPIVTVAAAAAPTKDNPAGGDKTPKDGGLQELLLTLVQKIDKSNKEMVQAVKDTLKVKQGGGGRKEKPPQQ